MRSMPLLMLFLFTRMDGAAVLTHQTRRAMLRMLEADPTLALRSVAAELDVHYKTALHHARMLAACGHLVLDRDGARVVVRKPGAPRVDAPPGPRAIAALVAMRRAGVDSPAALGRALGVPRGTAGSLLRALARRGLATCEAGAWRPSEEALAALPDERFSREASLRAAWRPSNCAR